MNQHTKSPAVIVIAGPTAVGKTAVALELARRLPAEIISADSRQIYRHMDIGTAKPTLEERQQTPHHFIDICDPDEDFTSGRFGREARKVVHEILQRDKTPIVVGGSGFYLRALLEGFSEDLPSDRRVRQELKRRLLEEGSAALHAELASVDPESARRLHPNDGQRIVRALEVHIITGETLTELHRHAAIPAKFAYKIFCLTRNRQTLYERINQRVNEMLRMGLVEECRHLLELSFSPELNALQTVGYKEVFEFLAGKIDEEQMKELIQRHSRQYAKRQLTWFRKLQGCVWLNLDEMSIDEIIQTVLA